MGINFGGRQTVCKIISSEICTLNSLCEGRYRKQLSAQLKTMEALE